jgi:hypothetical protein
VSAETMTCDVCGAKCLRLMRPTPGVRRVYRVTDLLQADGPDAVARCWACEVDHLRQTVRYADGPT